METPCLPDVHELYAGRTDKKVPEQNNFAKRMPVVEEQIKSIQDKIHYLHAQEKAGE